MQMDGVYIVLFGVYRFRMDLRINFRFAWYYIRNGV